MKSIHIHSVIVDCRSLEVLSADTDFYAYIGKDRLYSTFDQLMHPNSRELFLTAIKTKNTDSFVVSMLHGDGKTADTYMRISYEGEKLAVELEGVEELREGQELYSKFNSLAQELLGLHNDVVFTYCEKEDAIKFYTPDFKRCTQTESLQEFVADAKKNIKEEEYEKLDSLVASLKSEPGSFVYNFSGKIVSTHADCKNSLVKGFRVEGVDDITTLGYIHRASNKEKGSYTVEKDALTGTYSKREIANIARKTIEVYHQPNIAICILDVDYFKSVNDNFGHLMGDKVLKEIAKIIKFEVGNNGVVGRFGGDEFFVMFYDVENMELCREKLRSIKNRVSTKYPKSEDNSTVCVTLSIGCAVYPMDADNYDDLFCLADFCLYQAKDKGRNRYIIYNPEKHGTLAEIKDYFNNNRRIDTRKDLAMGDVLCMINDKHYGDKSYTPDMLVDDLVENLPIERILCLSGEPMTCKCMSGINLSSIEVVNKCAATLNTKEMEVRFYDDVLVVDDIVKLKAINMEAYNAYNDMGIKSLVLVRFKDAAGKQSFVSLEMTTKKVAWNLNHMYNYRTIARMFAAYEL